MPARRYVLLALATACWVGLGFTFPLAVHPATTVIEDGTYDASQFIWNVWWVNEALVHLHTNPFYTRYLMLGSFDAWGASGSGRSRGDTGNLRRPPG